MLTITRGAHWRAEGIGISDEPRQYAHIFDADSPEDVPHQAQNFILYSKALGNCLAPHIVIAPGPSGDDEEDAHIRVELADYVQVVKGATGVGVQIL